MTKLVPNNSRESAKMTEKEKRVAKVTGTLKDTYFRT